MIIRVNGRTPDGRGARSHPPASATTVNCGRRPWRGMPFPNPTRPSARGEGVAVDANEDGLVVPSPYWGRFIRRPVAAQNLEIFDPLREHSPPCTPRARPRRPTTRYRGAPIRVASTAPGACFLRPTIPATISGAGGERPPSVMAVACRGRHLCCCGASPRRESYRERAAAPRRGRDPIAPTLWPPVADRHAGHAVETVLAHGIQPP